MFVSMVLLLVMYFTFSGITGFSVFSDSGTSFNNGTYSNTAFNGSSIILSGTNLSGNYTSRIFDAGILSDWKNITVSFSEPRANYLFAVDSSAGVFFSSNNGTSWSTRNSDYGGGGGSTVDMFSEGDKLYILFSGTPKNVYRSDDFGLTWNSVAGNLGTPGLEYGEGDSYGNLYILRTNGEVIKSTNFGVDWSTVGDINGDGSGSNPKGIAISSSNFFAVDANAIVWKSTDNGTTWVQKNESYVGGGGATGTDDMAINFGSNIYILFNKQIYKSTNDGTSWSVVNNSFTSYASDGIKMISYNDILYIADASGRVFNSINNGTSWTEIGDLNGASANNPKGLTFLSSYSDVIYQARNCSSSDCAGVSFVGSNGSSTSYFTNSLSSFNLRGRYFQYIIFLSRNESGINPYLDNVSIEYDVAASVPVVNISRPLNGAVFGTNVSLELNFSASSSSGISSCWYSLNFGNINITLDGCWNVTFQNATFNVSDSGNYNLSVYANESLVGVVGKNSVSFNVVLGAPLIVLNSPSNNSYLNNSTILFNYTASDVDLQSCSLWGNFTGVLALNQTNNSALSSVPFVFSLNLSDGGYLWYISCSDKNGDTSSSENRIVNVDTINPGATINSPSGTYSSLTGIPLSFSTIDASPITCRYNLTYASTGGIVSGFDNVNLPDCANTSFNVVDETDYRLYLSINDSAGNNGYFSSEFSVDVPSGTTAPGAPGSSPSGGGGPSGLHGFADVNIINSTPLYFRRGQSVAVPISVQNIGQRFLNRCRLSFSGALSSVVRNSESVELGSGQIFDYSARLDLGDTAPSEYTLETSVICDETNRSVSLSVYVVPTDFDFDYIGSVRGVDVLNVSYAIEELIGKEQRVILKYVFLNTFNITIASGTEDINIAPHERSTNMILIRLPKDSFGDFRFNFDISNGNDSLHLEEPVFLSSRGIAGLAISEENRRTLSIFVLVVFSLILLFGVWHFLRRHHTRQIRHHAPKRKLIKLDIPTELGTQVKEDMQT